MLDVKKRIVTDEDGQPVAVQVGGWRLSANFRTRLQR